MEKTLNYGRVDFIQFKFSFIVVIWSLSLMSTMYVLLSVCIWVLGVYKQEALGALMDILKFCSMNCGLVFVCLIQSLSHVVNGNNI